MTQLYYGLERFLSFNLINNCLISSFQTINTEGMLTAEISFLLGHLCINYSDNLNSSFEVKEEAILM